MPVDVRIRGSRLLGDSLSAYTFSRNMLRDGPAVMIQYLTAAFVNTPSGLGDSRDLLVHLSTASLVAGRGRWTGWVEEGTLCLSGFSLLVQVLLFSISTEHGKAGRLLQGRGFRSCLHWRRYLRPGRTAFRRGDSERHRRNAMPGMLGRRPGNSWLGPYSNMDSMAKRLANWIGHRELFAVGILMLVITTREKPSAMS